MAELFSFRIMAQSMHLFVDETQNTMNYFSIFLYRSSSGSIVVKRMHTLLQCIKCRYTQSITSKRKKYILMLEWTVNLELLRHRLIAFITRVWLISESETEWSKHTSALYILIRPWLTLDQEGTALMFHSWLECSAKGPVFICRTKTQCLRWKETSETRLWKLIHTAAKVEFQKLEILLCWLEWRQTNDTVKLCLYGEVLVVKK